MKTLTKVSVALALIGSLTSVMAASGMQMGKGASMQHKSLKQLNNQHKNQQQMMQHQKGKH